MLVIEKFNLPNVGKYTCVAKNYKGQDSKEVSVSIKLPSTRAPTVQVLPSLMTLKSGENGTLECKVSNVDSDFKITWKEADKLHALTVKKIQNLK